MSQSSSSIRALLERRDRPLPGAAVIATGVDGDDHDYVDFAQGRIGNRPQMALVFQQSSGAVRGFPYAHFDGISSMDPANGFTVTFAGIEIGVEGRNLERLFRYVCDHKAALIAEVRRSTSMGLPDDQPVVGSILFGHKRQRSSG